MPSARCGRRTRRPPVRHAHARPSSRQRPSLTPPPTPPPARSRRQYFTYFNYTVTVGSGGSALGPGRCFLRSGALLDEVAGPTAIEMNPPAKYLVLFEAKEGRYATYPAGGYTAVGKAIASGSSLSFDAARAACDADATCIGLQNTALTGAASWRIFGGDRWEAATTKVKVLGPSINAWIPLPV